MATKTVPTRGGAQGKAAGASPPNQTSVFVPFYPLSEISEGADRFRRLYCTNLPDKLRKYDLRLSLYTLFSTYGTVLDVVAMKTEKMRGQAHIVFKDIQTSTQAMRALQGFDFFGKEMVCGLPFISQKGLSLTTCDLRKLYMPRELQMFLLDCVARTTSRQRGPPLPQSAALLPTFKNQSSVVLLDQSHCPRNLLVKPMGSLKQLTELNGNARRKVTKRRRQWMRIAMCQWKRRQMKIRSYRPYLCCFLVNWEGGDGEGRG